LFFRIIQSSILILLLVLIGCSKSEEQVLTEAYDKVESVFVQEDTILNNGSNQGVPFYVPDYLEVVEEDDHNVILEGKNNVYIIFINNYEPPESKTMYDLARTDDYLLYDPFESENMHGYLRVRKSNEEDKDSYEVQVGVGGVKITTNVKLKTVANEAEQLMKMAKSIVEETF